MDDLISRQAAIDALYELYHNRPLDYGRIRMRGDVLNTIENVPSAERRGRWENIEHAPNGLLYATCSVCGKRQTVEATNYCGNCGALLRGE